MLVGRHRCLSTMQIASVPGKRARAAAEQDPDPDPDPDPDGQPTDLQAGLPPALTLQPDWPAQVTLGAAETLCRGHGSNAPRLLPLFPQSQEGSYPRPR